MVRGSEWDVGNEVQKENCADKERHEAAEFRFVESADRESNQHPIRQRDENKHTVYLLELAPVLRKTLLVSKEKHQRYTHHKGDSESQSDYIGSIMAIRHTSIVLVQSATVCHIETAEEDEGQ